MSNKSKQRPETKVEAAEHPAVAESNGQERPETAVQEAENPAKAISEGEARPETVVEQAEKPQVVAAENKPDNAAPKTDKVLNLGDVSIPVISITNPHYGLSGPTVSVTVSVLNEDGTREGLLLNDIPQRLIK